MSDEPIEMIVPSQEEPSLKELNDMMARFFQCGKVPENTTLLEVNTYRFKDDLVNLILHFNDSEWEPASLNTSDEEEFLLRALEVYKTKVTDKNAALKTLKRKDGVKEPDRNDILNMIVKLLEAGKIKTDATLIRFKIYIINGYVIQGIESFGPDEWSLDTMQVGEAAQVREQLTNQKDN